MNQTKFKDIPEELNIITGQVVAAYQVHSKLGPGLLEKIYEICLCQELSKRGLEYERQTYIPIRYDGIIFNEGLRLDVIVNNCIICEIKAIETESCLGSTNTQPFEAYRTSNRITNQF